jgi:hypothetical protein
VADATGPIEGRGRHVFHVEKLGFRYGFETIGIAHRADARNYGSTATVTGDAMTAPTMQA